MLPEVVNVAARYCTLAVAPALDGDHSRPLTEVQRDGPVVLDVGRLARLAPQEMKAARPASPNRKTPPPPPFTRARNRGQPPPGGKNRPPGPPAPWFPPPVPGAR